MSDNDLLMNPPAGFEDVVTDLDGWYSPNAPEGENVVYGKIKDVLVIRDSESDSLIDVLVIQIGAPVRAYNKGDEEGEMLEVGNILGVRITGGLKKLLEYVENKGMVWFRPKKKMKLDGKRTFWKYEIKVKGKKAPYQRMVESPVTSTGSESSDIPDDELPF
jgi:hypothetical protein